MWTWMCLPVDSTQFAAISVSFSRRLYDFHTALAWLIEMFADQHLIEMPFLGIKLYILMCNFYV